MLVGGGAWTARVASAAWAARSMVRPVLVTSVADAGQRWSKSCFGAALARAWVSEAGVVQAVIVGGAGVVTLWRGAKGEERTPRVVSKLPGGVSGAKTSKVGQFLAKTIEGATNQNVR